MKYTIYITRDNADAIISRGLSNVYVWFHEPCLEIEQTQDIFSEKSDEVYQQLKGIIYDKNVKYNFIYRSENDRNSSFGDKLIRNDDGIDFPEVLVDFLNERKVRFQHKKFGDGRHVGYRKNSVADLFGFDNEISKKIWEMIIDEFEGAQSYSHDNIRYWKDLEKSKPWWKFCKKMEIDITISVETNKINPLPDSIVNNLPDSVSMPKFKEFLPIIKDGEPIPKIQFIHKDELFKKEFFASGKHLTAFTADDNVEKMMELGAKLRPDLIKRNNIK